MLAEISTLVAAAFTPPALVGGYIANTDYPDAAMRRREDGTVSVTMQVDPAGRVERCDTRISSGSKPLNQITCDLVRKRFRFRPARNAAQQPIRSVYPLTMNWVMPGSKTKFYRVGDLTMTLSKIPKHLDARRSWDLALLVTSAGLITGCSATWESKQPALARAACKEATAGFKPIPVVDDLGVPVEAVRVIEVVFKSAEPPQS